ncbi:MAG: lysophospholipid acyltransferase family protein [Planctomycetota bacterium]|nr:lysophospholipid acyltransferase family protein [Planctomycetota bacterium]
MSVSAWLNRPGLLGFFWRLAYGLGYEAFKSMVGFVFRPIWGVRRVGPPAALPRQGGVILCPNHTSYLDPAFVQLVVRRRLVFVMTARFYDQPRTRWFYKLVGAVPIGTGGRAARKGIRKAMALVKRGHAVVIFPEGRLSQDGHLNSAQRGIGSIARRTGAPVIPVALAGAIHAWPKGAPKPAAARVRVAFGKPMRYDEPEPNGRKPAEQAFADQVLRAIAHGKAELQARAPDPRDVPVRAALLQTDAPSGR